MRKCKKDLSFSNIVIDKSQLKHLIVWAFRNHGIARAANMADKLKDVGFYYATKAGISLSLEDLRVPPVKKVLLERTISLIVEADSRYRKGEITAVERFQKVIDTWNDSSEFLKKEVISYFKATDPLNSIYMMAFSGARGNISQVRQLVGMRGLMSDPQGQIIDLPISSNFREGLTVTDYFISSYGARKGLVDTALRTADSGYLTRRLVDVAQDVIIREVDCKTFKGILLNDISRKSKISISLKQSLIGRLLAEDLFHPENHSLIAAAGQDVNDSLAQDIVKAGISKVLVRSPITCNANSSVCQKCYGWNLAHGRLVDLGEAVGIIAAQSIGEPGTQLTMRTFHTGGVFTGEFADKVYAPFDAVLVHPDESLVELTRTSHGDEAYLVKADCFATLYCSKTQKTEQILLSQNSLLLSGNNTTVVADQLIAEYPLKSRLTTEKAQKSVSADLSGKIAFTDLVIEEFENKQHFVRSAQSSGLIWVLSGQVYSIPDRANFIVEEGEMVYPGTILAITEITAQYCGYIRILPKIKNSVDQNIWIVVAAQTLSNAKVTIDQHSSNNTYILHTYSKDKYLLKVQPNNKLINHQVIGELISDVYKTKTGGIIKYLDLPVSEKKYTLNHEYYSILGPGYILWITEETHEVNKDASLLMVNHGDFIDSGTEIIKNLFARNAGIVEVVEKDNIVREIIIKPCTAHVIDNQMLLPHRTKKRGFLRPGEKIVENITTDKLVYWEYLSVSGKKILLIRPVAIYSVPKKNYDFTYIYNSPIETEVINLKLVRQTNFRDGARVKSVHGVDLIKTYLTLEIAQEFCSLTCFMDLIPISNSFMSLKFVLVDNVLIKSSLPLFSDRQLISKNTLLVSDGSLVKRGQVIAQTEFLLNISGQIFNLQDSKTSNRRFLVLTDSDKQFIYLQSNESPSVKLNDWIYKDQEVADGVKALESGQVIYVDTSQIVIRIGRPYLISDGSVLHVDHNNLVCRGENIATLIFNRVKTGDIVQGLPRIEEILEARKKVGSNFNPHLLLERKFRFYLSLGLNLSDSTRASVQELQLLLVNEVQLVYQAQGVDISDKHIEIIVKQMTSKVRIENGGDTSYLPGEIVDLQKIESVNSALVATGKKIALYYPILLGITKASLNTESFISAASFQETTKVLTEAAISGKLDWLKGLKENVIIGRLIPAGTGFDIYNQCINSYDSSDNNLPTVNPGEVVSSDVGAYFEDIILDDRSIKGFASTE